jgi:hypothetical protein
MEETNYFLAVSSSYGIYTPQTFVEWYGDKSNIEPEDKEILLAGPDHDLYWETWLDVVIDCEITFEGKQYYIEENEDLWLVEEGTVIEWQ